MQVCGSCSAASEPLLPPKRRHNARTAACALLEASVAVGGSYGFNWIFHNPFCGVIFRCGCTWPWAGGWSNCNVHNASGPKCPWCNVRNTSLAWLAWAITTETTVALMVAAYAAVWLAQLRPVRRRSLETVAVMAASGTLQQPSRSLRPWWPSLRVRAARAAAAIAAFLLAGFALGLAFYRGTDYPCFLWIVDDATRCGGKA